MIVWNTAIEPCLWLFGLLFLGYAEIHYAFRGIPCWYRHTQPEILADVPRRVEPGQELPLLILVKDAHRFPVTLLAIEVELHFAGSAGALNEKFHLQESITTPWWYKLLYLAPPPDRQGFCRIFARIRFHDGRREREIVNDNYRGLSHAPFHTYFAEHPLPRQPHFHIGDLHTHSTYTSDQVEFGAPPEAVAALARASGHHFVAITDHSYDLDDAQNNYLVNDPSLSKWTAFNDEIAALNTRLPDFVILPGEEVSCGNVRGENVHLLAFNCRTYLPGAGDSGEKWLRTRPDLRIPEIVQNPEPGAAYFAAHPCVPVPFLENRLLRRGRWQPDDFLTPGLHGLQIWNGHTAGVHEAESAWVRLLLAGHKHKIIGGSDAHGNFNRFRQIGLPHLFLREQDRFHFFGLHYTGMRLEDGMTAAGLTKAMRDGTSFISSGPFLAVRAHQPGRGTVEMGGTVTNAHAYLEVLAYSTPEFGALQAVRLYRGVVGESAEHRLFCEEMPARTYAFRQLVPVAPVTDRVVYYRAETQCAANRPLPVRALTNPIWHES